jgi:iron complex outermembrane receptor protein
MVFILCVTIFRKVTQEYQLIKFCYSVLLTLFLLGYYLHADVRSADSLDVYYLQDSIVVIANRYELSIKSLTNSVVLIRPQNFPGVANYSVLQLVDMIPSTTYVLEKKLLGYGVGPFGAGTINMRGMGGKPNSGILILINGRPDFMGIFGHPLPDVYGIKGFGQIETIKGPASTIFGSNAMAGAINLVTEPPKHNRISLDIKGGNYNTFAQHFKGDLVSGKSKFGVSLSRQKTDGHIASTEFSSWNLEAQIERQINNNWNISLQGRYTPSQFNDPFMGPDLANLGYYGKIHRGMADIRVAGKTGNLNNSLHLYSNLGHHRFNDGFDSRDFLLGLSSYQNYKYSQKFKISFGFDAQRYGGKAKNVVNSQVPINSELNVVNSVGFYTVGFYTPQTNLTLQGGIRYQITSLEIQKITPTLGVSFLPLTRLKLFANYNHGFRLPTLQELYLFPTSNEKLDPEIVKSYEAGSLIYFYGENNFSFTYFNNEIENVIQQVANPVPPPGQIFQNSGGARQWGIETSIALNYLSFLQTQFSYGYLDPGQLTAYNPQNIFKYLLITKIQNLQISLFGKYIADFYSGNNQADKLDIYHVANFFMSYRLHYFILDLQLRNILDKEYQVVPGYLAPKFNFMIGINFNLFLGKG